MVFGHGIPVGDASRYGGACEGYPRPQGRASAPAMAPRKHGYAHARREGAGACWPVVWPLARGSLASLCLLGAATVRSLCPSGALGRSDPALAPRLPDVWCVVVLVWLL